MRKTDEQKTYRHTYSELPIVTHECLQTMESSIFHEIQISRKILGILSCSVLNQYIDVYMHTEKQMDSPLEVLQSQVCIVRFAYSSVTSLDCRRKEWGKKSDSPSGTQMNWSALVSSPQALQTSPKGLTRPAHPSCHLHVDVIGNGVGQERPCCSIIHTVHIDLGLLRPANPGGISPGRCPSKCHSGKCFQTKTGVIKMINVWKFMYV